MRRAEPDRQGTEGRFIGFEVGTSQVPDANYASTYAYAAGVVVNGIARWDGTHWSALPDAPDIVAALVVFDPPGAKSSPALYAGGGFVLAGGRPSADIAKWGCVGDLLLGDVNCDGTVDHLDIDPFVLALVDPGAYELTYPDCDIRTADCNYDGAVDAFDIDRFVELLTGG